MENEGVPKGNEGAPMRGSGSQSWLRDLWTSQRGFQTPLGRTSGAGGTLPVFFDGRVGPSALWWKEPHEFAAYSSEDGGQEAEEAELARASQAALEIAQVSSKHEGRVPLTQTLRGVSFSASPAMNVDCSVLFLCMHMRQLCNNVADSFSQDSFFPRLLPANF